MRRSGTPQVPPPAAQGASDDTVARSVMARMVARHGAPSLEDYRRTYTAAGLEWPGDDAVRARHPVADDPTSTGTASSTRHSAA